MKIWSYTYRLWVAAWVSCLCLTVNSEATAQAPSGWSVSPSSYEHLMTVTGVFILADGVEADSNYFVAAFSGTECRGIVRPVLTMNRWMIFLIMYGDIPGESLTFRAYHEPSGTFFEAGDHVSFELSGSLGVPSDPFILRTGTTSAGAGNQEVLRDFELAQNFPNPFNPSTRISFSIPVEAYVTVTVYDASGRMVSHLIHGLLDAGDHRIHWNSAESKDGIVSSGVYFCRMVAISANGELQYRSVRKMILTK